MLRDKTREHLYRIGETGAGKAEASPPGEALRGPQGDSTSFGESAERACPAGRTLCRSQPGGPLGTQVNGATKRVITGALTSRVMVSKHFLMSNDSALPWSFMVTVRKWHVNRC